MSIRTRLQKVEAAACTFLVVTLIGPCVPDA